MTFRKDVKSKDQVAGRGAKKQGTREGLPAGALRVETDTPTEKKTSRLCSNMFEPGQNCCFTTIGCGSRLCGQTGERYTKDASRNTPRKLCKDQKINDNNRSKKIK
jgi:hypothetical protein